MCKLLTEESPERFLKVSRSVRILGHPTSVRLEAAFWEALEEIARMENLTPAQLISVLYSEALEFHSDVSNLASVLRSVCLIYQEQRVKQLLPAGMT